jgi:hypothetical protein
LCAEVVVSELREYLPIEFCGITMEIASIAQPSRNDGAESIKVLVRVRPLSASELAERNDSVVEILSSQALNVTSADGKKSFKCAFDSVLGPNSSQTEVYDIVRGCTESVIDGFNSTIFAYGQTGSGKVDIRMFFFVKIAYGLTYARMYSVDTDLLDVRSSHNDDERAHECE